MTSPLVPISRDQLRIKAVELAPRLLGAVLESTVGDETVAVRLTEVEAYEGFEDPASHAFRGPTKRTSVMFGDAGYLYVYFTYGMHWCANVVCGVPGSAAAVLLRAGEVVNGEEAAFRRRPAARRHRDLARGPARLASALGLSGEHNGSDLCTDPFPTPSASVVRLLSDGDEIGAISTGPRVGITVAVARPWRFWIPGDPTVSTFRTGKRKSVGGDRAD